MTEIGDKPKNLLHSTQKIGGMMRLFGFIATLLALPIGVFSFSKFSC